MRGYSYIRGATSEDRNTGIAPRKAPWYSCSRISLIRRSCPARGTTTAARRRSPRTPASTRYWILASRSSSSSGRTIFPRESTRSLHADDQLLADQRLGPIDARDVALVLDRHAVGPLARASDQRGVLEALGDQQAQLRALVLDQPVHGQRRRVADDRGVGEQLFGRDAEAGGALLDRLVHRHRQVVRGGPRLAPHAAVSVGEVAVGERAADIDVDRRLHPPAPSSAAGSGLQRIEVELDVVGQRMARREVLDLEQHRAARAVELDDLAPLGIGRETVLALDHGRVDLRGSRCAIRQPFL